MVAVIAGYSEWPNAALIRVARGLSASAKVFLYTLASHTDAMTGSAARCAEDMGLTRSAFYRVRERMLDEGLIAVRKRPGRPSQYRLVRDELLSRCPTGGTGGVPLVGEGCPTGGTQNRTEREQETDNMLASPEREKAQTLAALATRQVIKALATGDHPGKTQPDPAFYTRLFTKALAQGFSPEFLADGVLFPLLEDLGELEIGDPARWLAGSLKNRLKQIQTGRKHA